MTSSVDGAAQVDHGQILLGRGEGRLACRVAARSRCQAASGQPSISRARPPSPPRGLRHRSCRPRPSAQNLSALSRSRDS